MGFRRALSGFDLRCGRGGGGTAGRVEESPRPATTEGRGQWTRAGVAAARTGEARASLYCTGSSGTWPGCGVLLAPVRVL